jgi:hypothetical protein
MDQRFTPIPVGKVLPPPTHAVASLLEPAVLTLSTPSLLAEVNDGLALRVCRQQTTARDVLLVQALAARLVTASAAHARATNREPLEGMLLVDIPNELNACAPALSFDRFRRAA